MKDWYKVTVEVSPEAEEIASYILYEEGSSGIETIEKPEKHKIVLMSFHRNKPRYDRLIRGLKSAIISAFPCERHNFNIKLEEYKDIDWVKRQTDSLGVVKITPGIWVIPPWKEELQNKGGRGRIYLLINPGSAFGTGEHPTTQQCIIAIKKYIKKGDRVLDVGAGSGILSIAALKLGAGDVLAVEICEEAVANGRENVELNGLSEKVTWHIGTIMELKTDKKFDLIVMNIFSQTMLSEADRLKYLAAARSRFIFSGILTEGATLFLSEMNEKGFSLIEPLPSGEWMTYVMEAAG